MTTIKFSDQKEETFGEVLQKYRIAGNISQTELASLLNTSRNTVNNWENGRSKPDFDTIKTLVLMFGIPLYELFGIANDSLPTPSEYTFLTQFRQLSSVSQRVTERMVGTMLEEETLEHYTRLRSTYIILPLEATPAAAGVGCEECLQPPEPTFVRKNSLSRRADALIRVSGRSMEPKYHDGDLVYVVFGNDDDDGDDVVCYYTEGAVIKRVKTDRDNKKKLFSLNTAYPFGEKSEDDNVRVMGKVIGIVAEDDIPGDADCKTLEKVMSRELREFEDNCKSS